MNIYTWIRYYNKCPPAMLLIIAENDGEARKEVLKKKPSESFSFQENEDPEHPKENDVKIGSLEIYDKANGWIKPSILETAELPANNCKEIKSCASSL